MTSLTFTCPDGRRPLVFNWGVSSFYGWGVYGLNLVMTLAQHPDFTPVCAIPFGPDDLVLDPAREAHAVAAATLAQPLWDRLASGPAKISAPVLDALGNDLIPGVDRIAGTPTIGVVFLEQATLSPEGRERARKYPLIVAGSTWNADVLRSQGVENVVTVLQGVDASLFHPAPKANLFPGRFVVFSGGKLEYRKGQDIVLAAFKAFHQRHPEALLVAAWDSPWPEVAWTFPPGMEPIPRLPNGRPDVVGWAVANGIPADAVFSVGRCPNIAMPHVIREADVALFPNRCEGGTNLVAMECIACGVPTVLSRNTGHLDLILSNFGYPLDRQPQPQCAHYDTSGWGESDAEEALEALEAAHQARMMNSEEMDFFAAQAGDAFLWRGQIDRLLGEIAPFI